MAQAFDDGILEGMRERTMADVMQQDGSQSAGFIILGNNVTLGAQGLHSLAHQVHCTDGMGKPGVQGARVDQVAETELPDPPQPLKPGMLDQTEDLVGWYDDDA